MSKEIKETELGLVDHKQTLAEKTVEGVLRANTLTKLQALSRESQSPVRRSRTYQDKASPSPVRGGRSNDQNGGESPSEQNLDLRIPEQKQEALKSYQRRKPSVSTRGKASMSRELAALNLGESKDFAFMYDKDNGWTQEKYYNLRSHSVLKSAYRKGHDDKYGPDFCEGGERPEEDGWFKKLCTMVCLVLVALLLYYVFIRKAPYCDVRDNNDPDEHCNYEELGIFTECRPCPWNAMCVGTEMKCEKGYEKISADLCLEKLENPYVAKLVSLMLEIDQGMSYKRNFMSFGAAHEDYINGKELLDYLLRSSCKDCTPQEQQRVRRDAEMALMTVLETFKPQATDKFCLAKRFEADRFSKFSEYDELIITSLKRGSPAATP